MPNRPTDPPISYPESTRAWATRPTPLPPDCCLSGTQWQKTQGSHDAVGKQIDNPIAKRGMFEGRKFRIDGKNEEDWRLCVADPSR